MKLLEFTMTGTAHSAGYKEHKSVICEGDRLEFVLDVHNQYDKDAIKVVYAGDHIGWVPKKLGEAKSMLARLLEEQEDTGAFSIECHVLAHEIDNPTDMQLIAAVEFEVG